MNRLTEGQIGLLVVGGGLLLIGCLYIAWPLTGYGAHPTRIPVTDQTTDTNGTALDNAFFGSLQSNMESDIEGHRHTGGVEGRTLASTALTAPINIGTDTVGTISSLRISPAINIGVDTTGTLNSSRLSPAINIGTDTLGTLNSTRISPALDIGIDTLGTISSLRISPAINLGIDTVGTISSLRISPAINIGVDTVGTISSLRISPALTYSMILNTPVSGSTAEGLVSITQVSLRFAESGGVALTSIIVVSGAANTIIKAYGFDVTLSSLGSVAIVCGCNNNTVLWSQASYTAGWGISKPLAPSGTNSSEPFAYITLPAGAALVVVTQGNLTNVANWNFLYSRR